MILVTGGSGFIGANFIVNSLHKKKEPIINLDKLTYAANQKNLKEVETLENYFFEKGSIDDYSLLSALLKKYQPRLIINFAAESHVDRSISSSDEFINTNIIGTHTLLKACLVYFESLKGEEKDAFRFIQISTDEVYGSLKNSDPQSVEESPYFPNSPYSASKASGDHLVRAWHETFGLPTITTNCTNNYGPYQHPEKLIPKIINHCLNDEKLPIYGDGKNIRDWIHVYDHVDALFLLLQFGRVGQTYNIGGECEMTNINIVKKICDEINNLKSNDNFQYKKLISFVKDRKGHDFRYAIDNKKIFREFNWKPKIIFNKGLKDTVISYL